MLNVIFMILLVAKCLSLYEIPWILVISPLVIKVLIFIAHVFLFITYKNPAEVINNKQDKKQDND